MTTQRVLVWFSCGAASAVAARLAVQRWPDCEVLYCDTFAFEHPDNRRFLRDVEQWIGKGIKILKSNKYTDIFDVWRKTGWLIGVAGARCTVELKKKVRRQYQRPEDIHVFGLTSDEGRRIERFEKNNPDEDIEWILRELGVDKAACYRTIMGAGIELPAMYKLGYNNNNCIGCVKGGQGYWNKIRVDFPDSFDRMARLEREMGVAINKNESGGIRRKVYLDELHPNAGRGVREPDIDCGVLCLGPEAELVSIYEPVIGSTT